MGHRTIIEFAPTTLDPRHGPTFLIFDRMRRKRNDAFYDIALITETEPHEAVATAESYLAVLTSEITAILK